MISNLFEFWLIVFVVAVVTVICNFLYIYIRDALNRRRKRYIQAVREKDTREAKEALKKLKEMYHDDG